MRAFIYSATTILKNSSKLQLDMSYTDEKYGGIFLYEITAGDKSVYAVANPDRVRELLSNHSVDLRDLNMENSEQIKIERVGFVFIDSLTLERMVADENERARIMGRAPASTSAPAQKRL
jgi:hypothetical protein